MLFFAVASGISGRFSEISGMRGGSCVPSFFCFIEFLLYYYLTLRAGECRFGFDRFRYDL